MRGALNTTPPPTTPLAHSETLASPAADLAEEHSLTESEQTLLADQAYELWL